MTNAKERKRLKLVSLSRFPTKMDFAHDLTYWVGKATGDDDVDTGAAVRSGVGGAVGVDVGLGDGTPVFGLFVGASVKLQSSSSSHGRVGAASGDVGLEQGQKKQLR
jgi:hypothetical protein